MSLRKEVTLYDVNMLIPEGCQKAILRGESAVYYSGLDMEGYYHNAGEFEAAVDVWEEGHSDFSEEELYDDPILARVKDKLGIK